MENAKILCSSPWTRTRTGSNDHSFTGAANHISPAWTVLRGLCPAAAANLLLQLQHHGPSQHSRGSCCHADNWPSGQSLSADRQEGRAAAAGLLSLGFSGNHHLGSRAKCAAALTKGCPPVQAHLQLNDTELVPVKCRPQ